jgi:hypothetical protein
MQTQRIFSIALYAALTLALLGCTKDRLEPSVPIEPPPPLETDIERGDIVINEFMASGSTFQNEFGVASDWIELFNPAFEPFTLEAGHWYITDDASGTPRKYLLPEITLAALGFVVIWCDNADVVANDIHTNFALSSAGEELGLYYAVDESLGLLVDDYLYGAHELGLSEGRTPDGGSAWTFYTLPTPGESNN